MAQNFDVVVVGAGPGGYVCAIRSAQMGLKTAIVEREYMGGVCLNVGCIPSKALITAGHFLHKMEHNAPEMGLTLPGKVKVDMKQLQTWKKSVCDRMAGGVEQLLKGNTVTILRGEASFKSATEITVKSKTGTESVTAKNFVIATGSRPIEIPGFAFDEKNVLSSTGGLALDEKIESAVVIGGGYIGLEIGSMLSNFGTKVTVVEANKGLLVGLADAECVQVVARKLKKNGVDVMLEAKAKGWKKSGKGVEVTVEVAGKEQTLKADKVLVTVGRKPNSDQANLKGIGLAIDEKGFVKVNAERRTNFANIFAIGDIACQPMLAHKASHEGVMVAEIIAGKKRAYEVKTVPSVIFVDPEIAAAGMTEEEAKAAGYTDLKIGKFPFAANGRAVSLMETDGFVKIIADAKTHIVLGVHIVGPEASNLISEAALAVEMGARLEDLALTIHPHPTLGETMMEAAEATLGHAIHIIQKPLGGARAGAAQRPHA
ncbi:MAG: dihydrolipoyl dehydrogenase [Bdellovibrionales bacterium]|jgi:dihydrolipoamide dehydrogenase|nr:dihydrolipoyl dehydrogenase [Bdellovibrionales bacterium]